MTSPERTEGTPAYFNEFDQELLEKGVPSDLRIAVSESVHFQQAGKDQWEDARPYPAEDAARFTGQYNMMNSALCFVDRNGSAWITGDGPIQRKALERAGYSQNPEIHVPFAQGELLSAQKQTSSLESQQDQWKRIKALAQRDWDEERARENQQTV